MLSGFQTREQWQLRVRLLQWLHGKVYGRNLLFFYSFNILYCLTLSGPVANSKEGTLLWKPPVGPWKKGDGKLVKLNADPLASKSSKVLQFAIDPQNTWLHPQRICTVCRSTFEQDTAGWRCAQWSKWCQFACCQECMERHREACKILLISFTFSLSYTNSIVEKIKFLRIYGGLNPSETLRQDWRAPEKEM